MTQRGVGELAWQIVAEVLLQMQSDLDREWTLLDASRVAGYELHHFAHSFRSIVGVPPSRYVRQLRLERAAHELIFELERSVTEIARRAGYGSLEAFSRAFRRAYAIAPRRFRREGTQRVGASAAAPAPLASASLEFPKGLSPGPVIEQLGPLHGWSVIIDSFDLEDVFRGLAPLLSARPPTAPWQLGGVSQPWGWRTGAAKEMRLVRLVDAREPPPGPPLLPWRLPCGWFARFEYRGPPEEIVEACAWIMGVWVPRSGLRAAYAPLLSLLGGDLDPSETNARLYAAVEPLRSPGLARDAR